MGHGSGVIVGADGLVATNLHVVRGQKQAAIKLANGDVYDDVVVVDVDERRDLVLLKIKAFGLAAAPLGNSDLVQTGDRVVLIGSPRGLDQTVSDGLVSSIRDSGEGYRLFQTSAAASPGSSGGGMFDESGALVGIVTSKLSTGENLNFAVPFNYMRGLLASRSQSTLAELAVRFPAAAGAPPAGTQAAPATSTTAVSQASLSRMSAILSASGLDWTKNDENSWTTSFKGNKRELVKVFAAIYGDLVVTQSIAIGDATPTPEQMSEMLRLNFSVDLVKWSIDNKKSLVLLNETELRLLDGPGLKRIVEAIAARADTTPSDLAAIATTPNTPAPPPPSGSPTISLLQGHAVFRYDPARWKLQANSDAAAQVFNYSAGDLWSKVFTERIQVALEQLPDLVLQMARTASPDVKITRQGYRSVNGKRLLFLEYTGTLNGILFAFYGHYYSDSSGTIYVVSWTGQNLLSEYRPAIEQFASGVVIN